MSSDNLLEKVKQLREITGVGFKDCKSAIDETNGDIEKSVELLRKKGIAKASKRMGKVASEGLVCIAEKDNKFSIIEINSETYFDAKNSEFIKFVEEVSEIALIKNGRMNDVLTSNMHNKKNVKDTLVDLISKIGEKITLWRTDFIGDKECINFSYTHSSLKKNVGKLGVLLCLKTSLKQTDIQDFGKKLTMQIAASSPLAIDKDGLDESLLSKEKEIITEELRNSGKDTKIVEKIALGKLNKFINDNTLMNQEWIIDPKKKVKDVLKEISNKGTIQIKKFVRFKVGEGV